MILRVKYTKLFSDTDYPERKEFFEGLNIALSRLPKAESEEVYAFYDAIMPWLDMSAAVYFARYCNKNDYLPEDFESTSHEAKLFAEAIGGAQEKVMELAMKKKVSWQEFSQSYNRDLDRYLSRAFEIITAAKVLEQPEEIDYQSPDKILIAKELVSELKNWFERKVKDKEILLAEGTLKSRGRKLEVTAERVRQRVKKLRYQLIADVGRTSSQLEAIGYELLDMRQISSANVAAQRRIINQGSDDIGPKLTREEILKKTINPLRLSREEVLKILENAKPAIAKLRENKALQVSKKPLSKQKLAKQMKLAADAERKALKVEQRNAKMTAEAEWKALKVKRREAKIAAEAERKVLKAERHNAKMAEIEAKKAIKQEKISDRAEPVAPKLQEHETPPINAKPLSPYMLIKQRRQAAEAEEKARRDEVRRAKLEEFKVARIAELQSTCKELSSLITILKENIAELCELMAQINPEHLPEFSQRSQYTYRQLMELPQLHPKEAAAVINDSLTGLPMYHLSVSEMQINGVTKESKSWVEKLNGKFIDTQTTAKQIRKLDSYARDIIHGKEPTNQRQALNLW